MSGFAIIVIVAIGVLFVATQSEGSGIAIVATVAAIGIGAYVIFRGFSK